MEYHRTILHVDDDPALTRLVAHRLAAAGYEVTSVVDPTLALHELNNSHQRLVLLDIDMPQIDGLRLLREIKGSHGGTQVIMLTGLVSMQTVLQSFRWGAEFCLFKPLSDFQPLLTAIERTFWKIDQWWAALDYLSQQRRAAKGETGKQGGAAAAGLKEAGDASPECVSPKSRE